MEVEQQPTGVPDGWEVVSAPARPTPTPNSDARPSVSARAGVPAAGRGSQIDPDRSMHGLELVTTPLAHPTGIDAIDGMTSPVGLASLAAGGAGIVRAGVAGGALAGAKEAVATASPLIKYEATKTVLEKLGVPSSMAVVIAMGVSGYKKGAKAEPVSTVPPAGVETAQDALARKMASAPTASVPPVEPVASAPAPPAPSPAVVAPPAPQVVPNAQSVAPAPISAPAPSALPSPIPPARMGPDGLLVGRPGGNPDLPDQRALNEAALAARRAAARVQPPAPAVTKPMLLASEAKEYVKLLQSGKTAKEAMASIELQRQFLAGSGLTTPTAAETRFPKGMRGGSPK